MNFELLGMAGEEKKVSDPFNLSRTIRHCQAIPISSIRMTLQTGILAVI